MSANCRSTAKLLAEVRQRTTADSKRCTEVSCSKSRLEHHGVPSRTRYTGHRRAALSRPGCRVAWTRDHSVASVRISVGNYNSSDIIREGRVRTARTPLIVLDTWTIPVSTCLHTTNVFLRPCRRQLMVSTAKTVRPGFSERKKRKANYAERRATSSVNA